MVVQHKGNQDYTGLSTDTKPTPASSTVNAIFTETDTARSYINSGAAWIERTQADQGPGRWFIYRVGTASTGPYKALNKKTAEVKYSGSSIDAVLDPVLVEMEAGDSGTITTFNSSGGHIYVDGSDAYYYCSAGFDGFTIPQYTTIEGPLNARILVPNAYASYVFRVPSWFQINPTKYTSSTQGITIKGFSMHENGTPVKNWTGILFEAYADPTTGAGGIAGCRVEGTRINNAKTGLMLNQVNGKGWITTCWFEKMYIAGPKWAGVDQQLFGTDPPGVFGNNVFRDIAIQSSSGVPAYGFRNMGQVRCIYDNCLVWDVINGQIKGTIDPTTEAGVVKSEDNLIIGGIVAHDFALPSSGTFAGSHALVVAGYYNTGDPYPKMFQDNGKNTAIIGDFQVGNQLSKIYIPPKGIGGFSGILSIEGRDPAVNSNIEVISAADTVGTTYSLYNKTKSERFFIQRGTTVTSFESVKQTAGGTLRPMVFRMNDVPGTGTIESFRVLITGDLQIADARNIALNTATGTKIGTATTQKLGFFNATPVVQQSAITSPTADVTSLKTAVDAIRTRLTALGLTA
jgi:hypothetical protein